MKARLDFEVFSCKTLFQITLELDGLGIDFYKPSPLGEGVVTLTLSNQRVFRYKWGKLGCNTSQVMRPPQRQARTEFRHSRSNPVLALN